MLLTKAVTGLDSLESVKSVQTKAQEFLKWPKSDLRLQLCQIPSHLQYSMAISTIYNDLPHGRSKLTLQYSNYSQEGDLVRVSVCVCIHLPSTLILWCAVSASVVAVAWPAGCQHTLASLGQPRGPSTIPRHRLIQYLASKEIKR